MGIPPTVNQRLSALPRLDGEGIHTGMIRRLIIDPFRRWLGWPNHYRLYARGGHIGLRGR